VPRRPQHTPARSKAKRIKEQLDPGPDLPVGTEFAFVIPGTIRKNTRIGNPLPGGGFTSSIEHKAFRERVARIVQREKIPRLTTGRWGIEIVQFWNRQRHLSDLSFPVGDVDAPGTAVLDALDKGALLFDDDVRIGPMCLDRGYDKDHPRIEVVLKRWE